LEIFHLSQQKHTIYGNGSVVKEGLSDARSSTGAQVVYGVADLSLPTVMEIIP
jgi:hypothetical protein